MKWHGPYSFFFKIEFVFEEDINIPLTLKDDNKIGDKLKIDRYLFLFIFFKVERLTGKKHLRLS